MACALPEDLLAFLTCRVRISLLVRVIVISGILEYLQPEPWFIGRAVYPTIAVSASEE
jgi:hypothetical protein